LRNGLGALLIASRREVDPIAIHYSQASMRSEWMQAQKPHGDGWVRRSSSSERLDSQFLRLRESWCRLIEDLGLQYNFVAYGQVEQGELLRGGYRVLVLPRSSALSSAEAQGIREFVAQGGTLIADGEPGAFDEHSRKLEQSSLADLFTASSFGKGRAILLKTDTLNYHQNRLTGKEESVRGEVGKLIRAANAAPEFAVADENGRPVTGVETHRFRNGGVTIVALHRNPDLRVDELGPPEFKSNARFDKPLKLRLSLPRELQTWNIRTGESIGRQKQLTVTLDAYEPAIFGFSEAAMPELTAAAPEHARRGVSSRLGISFRGETPADVHVLHIETSDPSGKSLDAYSGNVRAPRGKAVWTLPLAANDPQGAWQLRVRDAMTGQTRTISLRVE
jgi:hypothetical protein